MNNNNLKKSINSLTKKKKLFSTKDLREKLCTKIYFRLSFYSYENKISLQLYYDCFSIPATLLYYNFL